jgi:hypothetical protein
MSGETAAILLGAISGGSVSYFFGVITSSKMEKPNKFNKLFDELKTLTTTFNDLAIQYWSADIFNSGVMLRMLTTRSEIFAVISRLNAMQDGLFAPELLKNKYMKYTTALTMAPFGSENNHISDSDIVINSVELLDQCRNFIENRHYRINHWIFWNTGLK